MTKKKETKKKEKVEEKAPETSLQTKAVSAARKRPISNAILKHVSVLIHSQLQSKKNTKIDRIDTEVYKLQFTPEQKQAVDEIKNAIIAAQDVFGFVFMAGSNTNQEMVHQIPGVILDQIKASYRRGLRVQAGLTPERSWNVDERGVGVPSPAEIHAKLMLTSLGKENFQELLELVAKEYDLDIKQLGTNFEE